MVDYSKRDALELSDDSDIEVHPNVDKRTFIQAKQHQIHMERQQRKRQIQALQHESAVNDALLQRLHVLAASLESQRDGSASNHSNLSPAEVAFQTAMRMLATIIDEVTKALDEKQTEKHPRYEAFTQELGIHVRKIQDLQAELARKLGTLELQDANKIASESYHVGFDSSYVNKTKPGDATKQETKRIRASPAAKLFAQIPASNYRASRDYLLSHPEVLQNESKSDGLFIEAYYVMLDQNDEKRAWQYVHKPLLLQYTRMLGHDGVALFFKCITTPGYQAHEVFEKDVAERFQKIRSMAKRDSQERSGGVEQAPPTSSEDEEMRKARKIFEQFSPEMRAALESGSLDEVNGVLAEMVVSEAEKMVGLLNETGCLSIEEDIIDATTEEGKRHLLEIEMDAIAHAHPTGSTV
ncbi:Cdc37 N terminal kinase binding-domain-containing protein [Corynascus novoguineensis]|uniref:Hsp90 chaperone protein kinase-targeting subunit n=1 Tax=Corynascus novoguineensis TaxID=1126955 RepID=A0AAN7CXV8_9PEZI|nr:Cdc37 N terminal kinase binding-domain-containing protein [Corynascus novoguineensis]